jgi:Flp pilus assembly protein TadB
MEMTSRISRQSYIVCILIFADDAMYLILQVSAVMVLNSGRLRRQRQRRRKKVSKDFSPALQGLAREAMLLEPARSVLETGSLNRS